LISTRIGWLTYEDITSTAVRNNTLAGDELEDFKDFFRERCLMI